MTAVDVVYRYGLPPSESVMRALGNVRDVYGIRRIAFDDNEKTVRVEFDATRLTEEAVANMLRRAGLDLQEKIALV